MSSLTYNNVYNLIGDISLNITNIIWNVYGKVQEIQRYATVGNPVVNIKYTYDASGNRISKQVTDNSGNVIYTWYVRDAQGNVMSTYTSTGTGSTLSSYTVDLSEQYLYGSSRLGILNRSVNMKTAYTREDVVSFYRGYKQYELSNHLGNVWVTITDKKTGVSTNGTTVDNYTADVSTASDYFPFGMRMPGRTYAATGTKYKYGFNGKENDNEVKGEGNQLDYGMRIYDPRLGRFLSVDPLTSKYPMLTPYQFASNMPIAAIDLDGAESFMKIIQHNEAGKITAVDLVYDESIKALSNNRIYVQHSYPNGSVMKFESLGPLDFTNSKYHYPNAAGNKEFSVRREYNPFYNLSNNNTTLAAEFMAGVGSENSIIIGGKMLNDIRSLKSVQSSINEGIKSLMSNGKLEPGESVSIPHKFTYKEGVEDVWLPALLKGGVKYGSEDIFTTQHFLGSYYLTIDVLEDGKTGLFTLSDSKTIESVTDHQKKGNSVNRKSGEKTPWGSTYQRYIWTAPLELQEKSKSKE